MRVDATTANRGGQRWIVWCNGERLADVVMADDCAGTAEVARRDALGAYVLKRDPIDGRPVGLETQTLRGKVRIARLHDALP